MKRFLLCVALGSLPLFSPAQTVVGPAEGGGLDLLCGPTWNLFAVEVLSPPAVEAPGAKPPTLVVTRDGKLSGQSGCNRYFGEAKLDDRQVFAPGPLNTTRKLCDVATMKAEGVFLERMQAVVRYVATTNELRLLDESGGCAMVFHKEVTAEAGQK